MRTSLKTINSERSKLDKAPLTEDQMADTYRSYMRSIDPDVIRHEDDFHKYAIAEK